MENARIRLLGLAIPNGWDRDYAPGGGRVGIEFTRGDQRIDVYFDSTDGSVVSYVSDDAMDHRRRTDPAVMEETLTAIITGSA